MTAIPAALPLRVAISILSVVAGRSRRCAGLGPVPRARLKGAELLWLATMLFDFAACTLDTDRLILRRDGESVAVEPQVVAVLVYLIEQRGQVVSKEELLDAVWGDQFVSQSALTSRVASLRAAVGDDGKRQSIVRTVHRRGYEFVAEVTEHASPAVGEARIPEASIGRLDLRTGSHTNLPAVPTELIGRDRDVERVVELLAHHRVVTISASGGSGKTRLALAIGERELPRWPDGVWFIDLTEVVHGARVPSVVGAGLGVNVSQGDDGIEQLVDAIESLSALVILDNCEHLVDACAEVAAALLRRGGESRLVATSREALDVAGEHVYRLQPLDTDGKTSAAVQLFTACAQAADSTFAERERDAGQIAELCRRLDGSPLAIELAASRTTVMSVHELLGGLGDRFELLQQGGRRRRQRTLEATLDWSFELLTAEEQDLFVRLSVFPGTFDLRAAAAVGAMSAVRCTDLVESLVAKSLVSRSNVPGSARFRLYETTAAYAHRQLRDAGSSPETRERHLDHFGSLCGDNYPGMYADLAARRRLGDDRANFIAAYEWASSRRGAEAAAGFLLRGFTLLYSDLATGIELADRSVEALGDLDTDLTMRLIANRSFLCLLSADLIGVQRGTEALRASPDPLHQVFGLAIAGFAVSRFDGGDGVSLLEQAVALSDAIPPGPDALQGAAIGHALLAMVHLLDENLIEARLHAGHAIELHLQLPFASEVLARAQATAAVCALLVDEADAALVLAEEYVVTGSGLGGGNELRCLAHVQLGDIEQASTAARDHALLAARGRLTQQAADGLVLMAALDAAMGDEDRARGLLLSLGVCRQSELNVYSWQLADRLGVRDGLDLDAGWRRDGRELRRRAEADRARLQSELERRGWS